eukprot:TRINITY_DN6661_c0_g1_i2.p1 TRINITY_DN6661_c0_g1~~TRINITY_DN6661_c0_g1_i2.p1  ORF type:complete len:432 (-),score=58.13 TRINITY_DN6661_c0_g1_i2:184-1479(-)
MASAVLGCLACKAASCFKGMACNLCGKAVPCKKSMATRGLYAAMFFMISILAYAMHVWSYKILSFVPVLDLCSDSDPWCIGALAVYRILFSLCALHGILAVVMICVKNSSDPRAGLQDGWWSIKVLFVAAVAVGSFYIPNEFFIVWGWICLFGSFFFILIQLMFLIDFAYVWAEGWLGKYEEDEENNKIYYYLLLACTVGMYVITIGLTVVLFVMFYNGDACWMNVAFPLGNILIAAIYSFLSVHHKIQEAHPNGTGLLQSAVVTVYATYLIFSAATSEPNSDGFNCNPFDNAGGSIGTMLLGASFTIVAVAFSTVRTATKGNDLMSSPEGKRDPESQVNLLSDQDHKEEGQLSADPSDDNVEMDDLVNADDNEDDAVPVVNDIDDDEKTGVSYNYTFFHITFLLAAMYVSMLITNFANLSADDDQRYLFI